jgi:ribonuclease HI
MKSQTIILPSIHKTKSKIHMPTISNVKIFPTCEHELYFDGCSKGNPGPAGIGAVLYKNKHEIWGNCQYIGNKRTNNEAEYKALIMGLKKSIEENIKILSVYGDSLLVINQVNGIYKVKNYNLKSLFEEVLSLKSQFEYIEFSHVYRTNNVRADELANLGLQMVSSDSDMTDVISLAEDWDQEIVINKLLITNKTNGNP